MKKVFLLMAVILPFVFASCGDDKNEPAVPDNHEYVDLGLPSGTLWATCNVGANTPEEYGDYFAWGETAPKTDFTSITYKWIKGNVGTSGYTKYCTDSLQGYKGFTDGKIELESADDAATANWGAVARMPSLEQFQELVEKCSWQWTQRNGVYGQLGIGPNGNTIFLPAAGLRSHSSLLEEGSWCLYWSRMLCPDDNYFAYNMGCNSSNMFWNDHRYRACGIPVCAVRASQN